jgi:hypothetical protein
MRFLLLFPLLGIGLRCGPAPEASPQPKGQDVPLKHTRLGISFPPVRDAKQRELTLKHLKELGVSLIRFAESWKLREPEKGRFKWRGIDDRLSWASENGISVLLTIQSDGPDWACKPGRNEKSAVFRNDEDFRRYVSLLLKRHGDKIDKIQFGNEWQSEWWYVGTKEEFVRFNNIVHDEIGKRGLETKVVLGGFTTSSLRFLACREGLVDRVRGDKKIFTRGEVLKMLSSGKGKKAIERAEYVLKHARYDMIDVHLYDDVEDWEAYVKAIRRLVPDKPILTSEFGGPHLDWEEYSDEYHAKRVEAYIRKIDALKIVEGYYFKLVQGGGATPQHQKSGLLTERLRKKPAYDVFRRFRSPK